jgi:hypothetical protein
MFALPMVICYTFQQRPLRFALGVAGIMLAAGLYQGVYGPAEVRVRGFFGVHRVTIDSTGAFRVLVHGNTIHGQQSLDPARRREPLTYYSRTGPAGQVMQALDGDPRLGRVGIVGLGTGAMFCYASQGQRWSCFEIDPAVIYLARDSGLFSFLSDCPAQVDYVVGDARLSLSRYNDRFGLLVIDAFSSDAIPVHLLTREALAIYRRNLADDGLLLFNISNRFLDLAPVLAALAHDADEPMLAFYNEDLNVSEAEKRAGKSPSQWLLMTPSHEAARKMLEQDGRWRRVRPPPGTPVWTDDHANIFRALK